MFWRKLKVSFGGFGQIMDPEGGFGQIMDPDILEHDNTEIFYSCLSAGCINFHGE